MSIVRAMANARAVPRAASATALPGQKISADVSGGSWTLTLPASPSSGTTIEVFISKGDAAANPLTVDGNGRDIEGDGTLVMDVPRARVILFYNGTEWRIS